MQAIDIPIIGDSNQVPQDDPESTVNMYAEQVSDQVYTLKPTPGTTLYGQFGIGGGGRGIIAVSGRLFGVRGFFFQELVDGVSINRGTLVTGSGQVSMISNISPNGDSQIMIVDDTKGYVFKLATDTFAAIADVNFFGGGSQVAYCADSAFVFKPGTNQFQASGLHDFESWDGLAIETALTLNTPIIALISNGDQLYVFSSDGFEVWQDQGLAVFPLQRVLAGDRIGILAPFSAIVAERSVYWLGTNSEGHGIIYKHSGGNPPERISNHSTERQLAKLPDVTDGSAFTYQALGHIFYVITFRSGNKTICYDKRTNLWHDRMQRNAISGAFYALPFIAVCPLNNMLLAIDYRDGKVWTIDDFVYTDDSNPIVRERITAVVPKEGDYLTYFQSAELFGQVGNTPVNQQNPNIMMRYSIDRGMTYSQEDWQTISGNYSYEVRTRWIGLGTAYGISLWFRIVAAQYISWRMIRLRAE